MKKNIRLSISKGMTIEEARTQPKVDMSIMSVRRIVGRKQNIIRPDKVKK